MAKGGAARKPWVRLELRGMLKEVAREGSQQRAISLVVRIAAFQAVDPGSNPGWRITFCFFCLQSKHEICGVDLNYNSDL